MERDNDGATLTFGTGREHSPLVLPEALRGCDQGAGVGPIGSFATFEMPWDRRLNRTAQALSIHDGPPDPTTVSPSIATLGVPSGSPAASSGTASPSPSPGSPARLTSPALPAALQLNCSGAFHSIYPCGGNMAQGMKSGQMLEQLQLVP